MNSGKRHVFLEGIRDGIPIALGYLAVSFSLGIAMRSARISALQGFVLSFFNLASAGEYAGLQVILADASYVQMALVTLIANARYLLMSCALSQKFSPTENFIHRLLTAFGITDELFGAAVARKGYLEPFYFYGALIISALCWALGTSLGIIAGNVLPARIVSALSVALYGMFLAIIIPPARQHRMVAACVITGFSSSFLWDHLPFLSTVSSGTKVIILTLIIAGAAAVIRPLKEEA
ncbi:MAG TPA: branched-chain amino acid ABC transporter permease [Erysipelotrichaceae bacterium]|nr:branched-chain amino acid ABC transporter permease [Erysipelotrichaceae bacterium]